MTKLLDRNEATELIGVSPNTFSKLLRMGLPFVKIGSKKYYTKDGIERFIDERTVFEPPTMEELAEGFKQRE